MNLQLLLWALTSAAAGFLFGFDTVVISGAEQTIQKLWNLDVTVHGLAMGAALWGTVIGAAFGGIPSDSLGRKKTLILIGVFYFVSAIWSGLANDVYSFMFARFLGGLGVGASTIAAPLYISEISPAAWRGRLVGLFQFNIVFGMLVAFLSNTLLSNIETNAWRWMLGVEAIPALVYTILCFFIPESPRWFINLRHDRESGLRVLAMINPEATQQDHEALADQIAAARDEHPNEPFFARTLVKPIMLAFLIAFFNQMSGINAVLYFAPRIFEIAGFGASASLLNSIGIGVVNLVFTFVGLWLIDRLGRRTLLIIGSLGYILSLGLCAWSYFTENFSIVPMCIFLFIASHAVGQGAVIWVYISEIFPNQHRANGQALGCFTHWFFAALITTTFPALVTLFAPGYVFSFFCGMMVLQLIWVLSLVPETKGVSLEEIQKRLAL